MGAMIGTTLGHFKIVAKIGEGGMGVVYRAEDLNLGRMVALKVLPPELMENKDRRLRFLREARAAAAVAHPNIATVHEVGEDQGKVFLAMELIEGKSLRLLMAGRALPLKDAVRLGAEIAEALAHAHRAHVVHRDLKPENVLLTAGGRAKVLDFGLAKFLREDPGSQDDTSQLETISQQLTIAGKVLGTPSYMSPEQARGEPVDSRSDVFSFGTLLYEMVTGRTPFTGRTGTDILSAILRDTPAPISELEPATPPELERIVHVCLEKDPGERYQDTSQLAVDLRKLRRHTESGAVPMPGTGPTPRSRSGEAVRPKTPGAVSVPVPRPSRRLAYVAAAGLALVALVAAGVWLRGRWQPVATTLARGDRVLVADFDNLTNRPGIEFQVRNVFEYMLARSQYFDVRVEEPGARGGRVDGAAIERRCATGECAGYLTGVIRPQGNGVVLDVTLKRVGQAAPIAQRASAVVGDDGMLAAIHNLTLMLRRDAGEAPGVIASVGTQDEPTTKLMPAYDALARAYRAGLDRPVEAMGVFREAVEKDPAFWEAYYGMAACAGALGDSREYSRLAAEADKRATAASDKQKLLSRIQMLDAAREYQKELEVVTRFCESYPFDADGFAMNAKILGERLFDFAAAERFARDAYRLRPVATHFDALVRWLRVQGNADAITTLIKDYEKQKGAPASLAWAEIAAAEARGEPSAKVLETLDRFVTEGRIEKTRASARRMHLLLRLGRLSEAEEVARLTVREERRAVMMAGLAGSGSDAAFELSWLERRRTGAAVTLAPEQETFFKNSLDALPDLASFAVETSLTAPLAAILAYHEKQEARPGESAGALLGLTRGALLVAQNQPAKAVQLLGPLTGKEPPQALHQILARASEALGHREEAAKHYEAVVANPRAYALPLEALLPLDQFRLGGLYERLGDKEKARRWYGRFLDEWQSADAGVTEVAEARTRLQALGGPIPAEPSAAASGVTPGTAPH
jgi:tetratricopeptide (TPR) repeat protein